jgi:ribA/ribD-fused uncharacterized protein
MDEYLQKLEVYHDEKMKFLKQKDKYIKCSGCENKKVFKETTEKLEMTCGSTSGDCGPQIIIELPKYIHYKNRIKELKESIDTKYNWEELKKFLDVNKEFSETLEKQETINEEIKRIEKLYYQENMEIKKKEIQAFYEKRVRKTKRCKEIEKELNSLDTETSRKIELRKEYVNNVQEMNEDYIQTKELIEDINPYHTEEEPKITIKSENYLYEKKMVKKADKKKKKEINRNDYQINQKVTWIQKGKVKTGVIIEMKGKEGAIVKDEKGKEKVFLLNKLTPFKEQNENEDKKNDDEENIITYYSRSKNNKWLSTFNKAEPFEYNGLIFPTVEHAFHAQKMEDENYQKLFTDISIEPKDAKKMGGKKFFEENDYKLRDDWNSVRYDIMKEISMVYYSKNHKMLEKLKETGDKKLIHSGFGIDDYWGIKNGKGENKHGEILMLIREQL